MKRHILKELHRWKASVLRKPLILKGARQVGKTYILMAFGEEAYDNIAYLNFESAPQLHELFSKGLNPREIIKVLSIALSCEIIPGRTLIFFDEIQECPDALTSLKYFNELANDYHVCAAGSLLGVTLANNKGFPVGKVDFLNLYPLNFNEFLEACGEDKLAQYLDDVRTIEPLPDILHEKLLRFFKDYLYTGGLPAVVLEYHHQLDFNHIRVVQNSILEAYRLDFAKHAPQNVLMKINQVWDVIPSQLSKENKKFMYSAIQKGARAQAFEAAIQWLLEAGLIYKIYNVSTPKLPLSAYAQQDIFKICLMDIGLLGAMAGLSAKAIIYGDDIFQEFKGAMTENYVAQALVPQNYRLFYWTSAGQAELDFLLQHGDVIYPLEVKSGVSSKKKSLLTYIQKYNPTLAIRTSPLNLNINGQIMNCPLYLTEKIHQLLV